MLTPNWNPDRRTTRQFAALCLVFFLCLGIWRAWQAGAFDGGSAFGFHGPWIVPIVLWTLAGVIGVPGLIEPRLVHPVYVGMMALTFPIGWVVSHVLLALVYFGMFTAMSLVFRLIGRDRLHMRFDRDSATYWKDRHSRSDPAQYFRLS